MNLSHTSPLDKHRAAIEQLVAQGKSQGEILEYLRVGIGVATSDRSLRRALKRWGVKGHQAEKASVTVEQDDAIIVTPVYEFDRHLNDIDAMVRERGLDPEEWEVTAITVNEWDSPTGETLKQMKLQMKKRKPVVQIVAARTDGWTAPTKVFDLLPPKRLVVLVGDQQAPYHNTHLHELFCEWLDRNKPDEGVLMGDTVDLPKISRHADDPEWAATTQECVDAAGQILRDYVQASVNTRWKKLPGNHDERLRRAIIDRLGDFYGLRQADIGGEEEGAPIHDPVHLLRLDELGIEYIRVAGSYDHAQIKLSPYLAARHGWIARKGSGASAHATLDHLGHSIVVGHTHRQSLVHQTKFDIDGKASTNAAVETGCMCRIEEGLGYAVAPDWQNGFATATIYEDGTFKLDLATYVNKTLYWRDQRYG